MGLALLMMLTLVCFTGGQAMAGSWEPQWKFQKNLVNEKLTLKKVRELERLAPASKEHLEALKKACAGRVFWTGIIEEFAYQDGYSFMLLRIGDDYVWALADDTARNLDYNRKGYRVGIKGTIVLDKQNRLYYLDAWSIILLEAGQESGFSASRELYGIPDDFTFSAGKETYQVSSPYTPYLFYWIKMHNPHYTKDLTLQITKSIIYYCKKCGIDPRLMTALFTIESAMDTDAVSWSGAIGLGQLMPGTAAGLGVDPDDVMQNIGGAVKYLSSLLAMWEGKPNQTALALASYNAGPGNVSKYSGIPPFSETRNYVFFITYLYKELLSQTRDMPQSLTTMEKLTGTSGSERNAPQRP
ncbi:MAG: lytic transglycosylase domain-containing protein [Candidatus Eremiobacteraeota bacterium]|nr:lytic transglycosylase domain-containing protein [Candidatus Eremiobacteraeota bacterium]